MAKNLYKSKLTKIIDITPSVKDMYFELIEPKEFDFKAGQFVMLNLPADPKTGKPVQRAYSVASGPGTDKNKFRLMIKHYELGVASEWVRTLKGGEEISFTGPFGKFLFKEPPAEQVVFVATSTGLAPFYSMLMSSCKSFSNVDYKVFMGVWNEKEIFYEKELELARKGCPKLEVNYVLDTPSPGYQGKTGRVTEHIEKLDLKRPTEFYLCGNPHMIKAVKEMLMAKGFPAAKIYTESYG